MANLFTNRNTELVGRKRADSGDLGYMTERPKHRRIRHLHIFSFFALAILILGFILGTNIKIVLEFFAWAWAGFPSDKA